MHSNIVEKAMKETDRGLYSKHADEAYEDHPHEIGSVLVNSVLFSTYRTRSYHFSSSYARILSRAS